MSDQPQPLVTGVAPPHSLEAEESVLGGVLLSSNTLRILVDEDGLRADHFYRDRHRVMFAAMCRMFEEAAEPDKYVLDVLTLSEYLKTSNELDVVGGKAAIDALTGGVPGLGGLRNYARIVIDHAEKRQLLAGTYTIQAGVLNHDPETVEAGRRMLDQLVIAAPGVVHHVEAMAFGEHLFKHLRTRHPPGFPLPWPGLERMLRMHRGHGTVVSGWTSVGKSQAAFQMLAHIARRVNGARCVAWITEMTPEEHGCRQLSRDTGIDYETLMAGEIEQTQHIDHSRLLKALASFPFGIVGAHGDSVETICRHIRQVRPDVALLDHFHALPDVGKPEEASDAISKLLAAAAMADCHLIVVAQLNRGRDDGAKRPPPTLRDLRSTSALEQLPSNVLLVHRDPEEIEDEEGSGDVGGAKFQFGDNGYLHLAKQRGGSTGVVPVSFTGMQFNERAPKGMW